jgi:hypothetical protein
MFLDVVFNRGCGVAAHEGRVYFDDFVVVVSKSRVLNLCLDDDRSYGIGDSRGV